MRFRLSYKVPDITGLDAAITQVILNLRNTPHRAEVRRCYLGDVVAVLDHRRGEPREGVYTIRTATALSDRESFRQSLKTQVEASIKLLYVREGKSVLASDIHVEIREVLPEGKLRFSLYLETIAEERAHGGSTRFTTSILQDLLQKLYEPNNHTDGINVDGLICLPIYSAEYLQNRMIFDIRCSMTPKSGNDNLEPCEASKQVLNHLHKEITKISGIKDFSIVGTHPSVEGYRGSRYEVCQPYHHQMAGIRIEYEGINMLGTALQVVGYLKKNGLEVRRAFIGEQDVSSTKKNRAIFKVGGDISSLGNTEQIRRKIQGLISNHYKACGLVTNDDLKEVVVTELHSPPSDNYLYLSCQIESSQAAEGFLHHLFECIDDFRSSSEEDKLIIVELVDLERFAPPRDGRFSITDITLKFQPFEFNEFDDNDNREARERRQLSLQQELGKMLVELPGVRWVSLKPTYPVSNPPLPGLVFTPEFHDVL